MKANPDEGQFWINKVHQITREFPEIPTAARRLEIELWRYYQERAGVVQALRRAFEQEGSRRVSMLNLAEHLIRIWGPPPKPKKPPA